MSPSSCLSFKVFRVAISEGCYAAVGVSSKDTDIVQNV